VASSPAEVHRTTARASSGSRARCVSASTCRTATGQASPRRTRSRAG
jgi:hypothetical protein